MADLRFKTQAPFCDVSLAFHVTSGARVLSTGQGSIELPDVSWDRSMPVRMKDIAKDLDVSVVTVSKVLRNQGDISAKTRERVLQRAKELNYQPNWVARSLVTRRTYLVGLVVPDLMHSFFAEIARAVSRTLRPAGYRLVIANSDEDADVEREEIEGLLARRVDALIIASAQPPGSSRLFRRIAESKTPFVLIDRMFKGVKAGYAGIDHEEIGRVATKHLIEQGCSRIMHLRGPENAPAIGRLRGFQAAFVEAGLHPGEVLDGAHNDASAYAVMQEVLKRPARPDGIVCYNDPVAAGAMKAIFEARLRVPEDIAVVGAGNVHYSDLLRVSLSTVDQNTPFLGEQAAAMLLEALDGKGAYKPKCVMAEPRLIVRESSRRAGS